MTDSALFSLARVVLPLEVLECFDIIKVESTNMEIHIYLDEKMHGIGLFSLIILVRIWLLMKPALSNGDLYTIVTNRDRHGREKYRVSHSNS